MEPTESDDDTVEMEVPPFAAKPPVEDRGPLGVQLLLDPDCDSEGGEE